MQQSSCVKTGLCHSLLHTCVYVYVTNGRPAADWLTLTGTSLIIHNTGLPAATLISFIWVLGGMCVAWMIIKFHELRMDRAALALVSQQLAAGGTEAAAASKDLGAALAAAKAQLAAKKGFLQRFLSLKAAHGMIMFVSWINIAGACSPEVVVRRRWTGPGRQSDLPVGSCLMMPAIMLHMCTTCPVIWPCWQLLLHPPPPRPAAAVATPQAVSLPRTRAATSPATPTRSTSQSTPSTLTAWTCR